MSIKNYGAGVDGLCRVLHMTGLVEPAPNGIGRQTGWNRRFGARKSGIGRAALRKFEDERSKMAGEFAEVREISSISSKAERNRLCFKNSQGIVKVFITNLKKVF